MLSRVDAGARLDDSKFLVAVFVMLTQVARLADTLLYIQLFSTVIKQVNAGARLVDGAVW